MANAKKSIECNSDQLNCEHTGWNDSQRDSWVTMAMAAATKSLRALNLENIDAKNENTKHNS